MQVAGVQDEVHPLERLVDLRPEVLPRLRYVRVRDQPYAHLLLPLLRIAILQQAKCER